MRKNEIKNQETDVITFEAFYNDNNALHNEEGAAWVERDRNTGVVMSECWFVDGLRHREDGPAVIERDPVSGSVLHEQWWREGEIMSVRDNRYERGAIIPCP